MIIDVTGVELIPGNNGADCPGNGKRTDADGRPIECCCEECDYFMCCQEGHGEAECLRGADRNCPRRPGGPGAAGGPRPAAEPRGNRGK